LAEELTMETISVVDREAYITEVLRRKVLREIEQRAGRTPPCAMTMTYALMFDPAEFERVLVAQHGDDELREIVTLLEGSAGSTGEILDRIAERVAEWHEDTVHGFEFAGN